ncbi:riboflavin synthase subunit alpha [Patescibacteria group bacterium]|nr:MAG: riboflavin synthase subunit alpha [Patescibacteria group bacterium]
MFTGIVQGHYPITHIEEKSGLRRFSVSLPSELHAGLQPGASVAVAGVCLTVTHLDGGDVWFDAMDETLKKTTIGTLAMRDTVNVERSYKIGDELGGHIVSGHVDGMAQIVAVEERPNNRSITFRVDAALVPYILPKGFVALDGCSLTVVDPVDTIFTVHLIPETLRLTTFGSRKVGERVNLEIDRQTQAIVDTVKRVLRNYE